MGPPQRTWRNALFPSQGEEGKASAPAQPSLAEVLLTLAGMFGLHLAAVCRVRSFWQLPDDWFDRRDYLEIAAIIRQGHAAGGAVPKFFFGFPCAIAGAAKIFSLPSTAAVTAICALCSFTVALLIYRLYGSRVAAVFIFVNYQWIVLSLEGGSEPLFMAFLFASFLAVRSRWWGLAALLASLATTVRPVGIFALVSFALVLIWRREWRKLAVVMSIALAIGLMYIVSVWIITGSPLTNFAGYRMHWGATGFPLTIPFGAIVPSYVHAFQEMRWTFWAFTTGWLILGMVGTAVTCLPRLRGRLLAYPPEAFFVWIYALFLCTYNGLDISWAFDRYLLPIVPLLLFAASDWIPRDRRVIWGGAILSALLSAAVVVGFKNVFGFMLP